MVKKISKGRPRTKRQQEQPSFRPFHLALPVHSISAAKEFYGELLGCEEGRSDPLRWQDYNFFGHQLVCHYVGEDYRAKDYFNPVDGDQVPVPHLGAVLPKQEFESLAQRLKGKVKFVVEPHLRFEGQPGAQLTMFFKDPSGNNLEFKSMVHPQNLFARYDINSYKK